MYNKYALYNRVHYIERGYMNPKKNLLNAVRNLSEKKLFEDITVQMILDEAEVSRGTFYKYYRDKYDLANAYYSEYVNEHILKRYDGGNWDVLMIELLEFVKANRDYFLMLAGTGRNGFLQFVSDFGYESYKKVYLRNMHRDEMNEEEKLELEFYNAGCVRIMELWIKDHCRMPVKRLAEISIGFMPEKYTTFQQ